jgi:hypothetical protein
MNKKNLGPLFIIIGAMVVLNVLNGQFDNFGSWFMSELLMLPGIVIGLSFHEFAHGIVSYKHGRSYSEKSGQTDYKPYKAYGHIRIRVSALCRLWMGNTSSDRSEIL